jgi:hypothetical protein
MRSTFGSLALKMPDLARTHVLWIRCGSNSNCTTLYAHFLWIIAACMIILGKANLSVRHYLFCHVAYAVSLRVKLLEAIEL